MVNFLIIINCLENVDESLSPSDFCKLKDEALRGENRPEDEAELIAQLKKAGLYEVVTGPANELRLAAFSSPDLMILTKSWKRHLLKSYSFASPLL